MGVELGEKAVNVSWSASSREEVCNDSCVVLWCECEWVRKEWCAVVLDQEVDVGVVYGDNELVEYGRVRIGVCSSGDEPRCF